jgi:hypothetical protein
MADAADKIESGEWVVPKLHSAMGGNAWDISKPRKGYDAQPDQATLINALIHAANVQGHPARDDKTSTKPENE